MNRAEPVVIDEHVPQAIANVDTGTPAEHLGPTVPLLVERLTHEQRTLGGNDRDLAKAICLEIAERADKLLLLPMSALTSCGGLMDRVNLYQDNTIVIRAHLFHGEASETFVHNHGQAMISTCLEGSYIHQIYEVDRGGGESSHHYRFVRQPNGIYSEQCDRVSGDLEEILCQPFNAGQSLFISALGKHKVIGNNEPVTTITIRDAVKRFNHCDILSTISDISAPTDSVSPITDDAIGRDVRQRLRDAVLAFQTLSGQESLPPDAHYEQLVSQVAETRINVQHIRDRVDEISSEMRHNMASASDRDLNDALDFCCAFFLYVSAYNSPQVQSQVLTLQEKLRAIFTRQGVRTSVIDEFFVAPLNNPHLTILPCLPILWRHINQFFRIRLGVERDSLPDRFTDLRTRLEALGFPRPPLDVGDESLRWLVVNYNS